MMGKKVLAAKSGRAACSCAAAGGGGCSVGVFNAEKQSSREAKSFLTGLTGFTGLGENLDNPVNPVKTKPSGVPWIGDVPEGWKVSRVKNVAIIQHGQDPKTDGDIPVYGSGEGSFKTCGEYKYGPTVLIGRKGATLHIPHYIEGKYWNVDTAFDVKMKNSDILRWFYYLAICFDYKAYMSQTTLPSMTQSDYRNMVIPLPNTDEQRAIADYLDEKCGAIDAAIAEAKKGIEEYKAWKKSLIFEVVTGKRRVGFFNAESQSRRVAESFSTGLTRFTGLGENLDNPVNPVKTKPSGIPWIGDVPEGWEVSRVKHHYELILGKMLCATSNNDANVRLPYVCAANVHFEGVALRDLKEMWFSTIEVKQYAIREGDLLVVEGGAGAGGAAICPRIDGIVGIQNSIILVRNKRCRDNRYLRYLLEALVKNGYVDFVCNKATIPHFTKDKLGNVPLPLPPLPEQQAIAAYLDEKCAAIDAMIAEKEALIADLEAYKKSLIYEVVTGKREVA